MNPLQQTTVTHIPKIQVRANDYFKRRTDAKASQYALASVIHGNTNPFKRMYRTFKVVIIMEGYCKIIKLVNHVFRR
jgi:hypothetical protein